MKEPKWISKDDVIIMNKVAVADTKEPHAIRDDHLLESALDRPRQHLAFDGEADKHQLAAIYAEGISQNHPFVQGNKRTALQAADIFLHDNGFDLMHRPDKEHANMMVALETGKITREEFGKYLRENSREIERERGVNGQTARKRPGRSRGRSSTKGGIER